MLFLLPLYLSVMSFSDIRTRFDALLGNDNNDEIRTGWISAEPNPKKVVTKQPG
jgi:hypothetical protein